MSYYQEKWEERKKLILSSGVIAGIFLLAIFVFAFMSTSNKGTVEEIIQIPFLYIFCVFVTTPCIAAIRVVFTSTGMGTGIIVEALRGFRILIVSSIFNSLPGMVLGLILMMVFVPLFMVFCIGYIVYLPISTMYYYSKMKNETEKLNEKNKG